MSADVAARRRAIDRKTAATTAGLRALQDLAAQIGVEWADLEGHGGAWLKDIGFPVVSVRCAKGHKLGGVWRTEAGPVFAAWPKISAAAELRMRRFIVTGRNGSRRRLIAQMLDPSGRAMPALVVGCDCSGLREVTSTEAMYAAYATAVHSTPVHLTI